MSEEWRDIERYKGIYQVSNLGRVRSLARTVNTSDGRTFRYKGKILQVHPDRHGYLKIGLYKDGKRTCIMVHVLVLRAFVGLPPDGHECNHDDGNKINNQPGNLEWVTASENVRHSFAHGLNSSAGEDNGFAKLLPAIVKMLREVYALGKYTQAQVGLMFGISGSHVSPIVRGVRWPDADGPLTFHGRGRGSSK